MINIHNVELNDKDYMKIKDFISSHVNENVWFRVNDQVRKYFCHKHRGKIYKRMFK